MKPVWILTLILVLLYQAFLGCWAWSGSQLPERVATHFNLRGEADGWMSRADNQRFMLIFGLVFPLGIVLLSWATRFLPRGLVNIPHREYWLAPQRRRETSNYFLSHSLEMACLTVCFMIGIQFSMVYANHQHPPHLPMWVLLAVLVPFLAGTVVWVLMLRRHFRRVG
jgi:ABC-type spermidine/putrescine transport system permease subunit I